MDVKKLAQLTELAKHIGEARFVDMFDGPTGQRTGMVKFSKWFLCHDTKISEWLAKELNAVIRPKCEELEAKIMARVQEYFKQGGKSCH